MLDIQKNIIMKNTFSTIIIVLLFCMKGQTQNVVPHVFVVENKSNISKEVILKTAKLNISDTSFSIESFAYVITGKRTDGIPQPAFGVNKGKTFSQELLNEISKFQINQSSLLITDVIVKKQKQDLEKSRKIDQHLTINF